MNQRPKPVSPWSYLWSHLSSHPLDAVLLTFPAALAARYFEAGELWVFALSCLAIVPLAGLMGRATESLAARLGAGIGGLLNATFGNAAELVIAFMALREGPRMHDLVKASITGSIIGNVLLVLGLSMFAGGLRYKVQHFNRVAASMGATLLTLATAGLMMPTLYYHAFAARQPPTPAQLHTVELLSEQIAFILAGVYLASLVFTFVTHRNLMASVDGGEAIAAQEPRWGRARALIVLTLSTVGVAIMGEMLVESAEHAAETLGMSAVFVGVVVVAIIGNAAEHSTAVLVALKNKMDLSFTIAVGSGIQIALFVAPLLVFASMAMGHDQTLDLHFTPMEIVAVAIAIVVLAQVAQDGQTHWLEGVMLLALYAVLALAFYHMGEVSVPAPPGV